MKSLRSHQPNTASLGFYNWTPSSADADGQERLADDLCRHRARAHRPGGLLSEERHREMGCLT